MNEDIMNDDLKSLLTSYQFQRVSDSEENNVQELISRFDSFKNYHMVVLSYTFGLEKNLIKSYISLLSITQQLYKQRKSPQNVTTCTEYEMIGIAELSKDYGRVLIRPETIADKIAGIFEHVEIDFEVNKEFSKKYFVVTTDENKLRMNVTTNFLTTISKNNGLEIDIEIRL